MASIAGRSTIKIAEPESGERERLAQASMIAEARAAAAVAHVDETAQEAIATCLCVFRYGMKRETVSRALVLPLSTVSHYCKISSAFLAHSCATLQGDIGEAARLIAAGCDFTDESEPKIHSLGDVKRMVLSHYDISADEFEGELRLPHLTRARSVFAYVSRCVTSASFQKIANTASRSHSTLVERTKEIEALVFVRFGGAKNLYSNNLPEMIWLVDAALLARYAEAQESRSEATTRRHFEARQQRNFLS